jgi:hypothetical protein
MPWDQSRPIPWKRILTFEAVYLGLFAVFVLIFQSDKVAGAIVPMIFAAALTTVALVALIKFGYQPNWLKSRAEMAEIRAQKIAARQAMRAQKSGKPGKAASSAAPDRYRPAPTKRTSTGPTNRPRRTNKTRKR